MQKGKSLIISYLMNHVDDKHLILWSNCMEQFEQLVAPDIYVKWIKPLLLGGYSEGVITIVVPNKAHAQYVDANVISIIKPVINRRFGGEVEKLRYVLGDKHSQPSNIDGINTFLKSGTPSGVTNPFVLPGVNKMSLDSQLNFDYTFENFIEGECNRLARAAGLSVASKPGESVFNPIFIFGESGLGKTHVAQAIGIEVKRNFPDKYVLYVSTQQFVSQFTAASQKKDVNAFVKFYQMMDVLIIDDIQELSGKPQTQVVFFNIFNHLHQNKKQLIFTSDKSPVELKDLENRLISRFKWGLSVELLAPDFETKVAIIKNKANRHNIDLSQQVVEYLAENIHSNVRELEGAVSAFVAHSTLLNTPATIDLAHKVLSAFVTKHKREITIDLILDVVCDFLKISKDTFLSPTRVREVVIARQVAMFLSKEYTDLSLKSIGKSIGGKSHATVVHSCNTVSDLIETNKDFRRLIEQIKNCLR